MYNTEDFQYDVHCPCLKFYQTALECDTKPFEMLGYNNHNTKSPAVSRCTKTWKNVIKLFHRFAGRKNSFLYTTINPYYFHCLPILIQIMINCGLKEQYSAYFF